MWSTLLTCAIICIVGTTVNGEGNFEKNSNIQQRNVSTTISVVSYEETNGDKETLEGLNALAVLKTDPRADLPSSFTICSSVMSKKVKEWLILFMILGEDGNNWLASLMRVDHEETSFFLEMESGKWANLTLPPVFANQWVRSCLAVNSESESGLLQWVVDGTLVYNDSAPNAKMKPTDLTGKLLLGATQNSNTKNWRSWSSDQVTGLNVFSNALTVREMQQNTIERSCSPDGDYLAWKDMQWNLKGSAKTEITNAEGVCTGHPSLNLYKAPFLSMESCKQFCQKLGSRSSSLFTPHQWQNLQRVFENLFFEIWLALNDKDYEGHWVDYYNKRQVNYTLPWAKGEPNGGRSENCIALVSDIGMLDFPCESATWAHACSCERTPPPYMRLRGLCSKTTVKDTLFQPVNKITNFETLFLVGLQTSIIFDSKRGKWTLDDKEFNVTAISKAPFESFTLGRHNWTIRGDKGCSEEGEEYTTELKLSGCLEGNFTCNDGQCVSMEQRCDQIPDCRDKSDEENCNIVVLEKSYNKNVPPITARNKKVNVSVSMDILKLVDIKEEDYSIEIQFSITLQWKENRATYENLKKEKTLNSLNRKEIEKLWLPEVSYENTDMKDTSRLGERWEWGTQVFVDRLGNFTPSGKDIIDEIYIFSGSENNLVMSQTYTRDFQCSYDFQMYPFDRQVRYMCVLFYFNPIQ